MRLVIDTNVLVSGLMSPLGAPARVLDQVIAGRAVWLHDARILAEYRGVLRRPRLGLEQAAVDGLLSLVALAGEPVIALHLALEFPDPDDRAFIEVARTASADALVTGNLRHFPLAIMGDVPALSPAALLDRWPQ